MHKVYAKTYKRQIKYVQSCISKCLSTASKVMFCVLRVLRVFSQDVTCVLEDALSCAYSVSCASSDFFLKTPKTDVISLMHLTAS